MTINKAQEYVQEIEAQTETENQTEAENQTEMQTQAEAPVETEMQTEMQTETEKQGFEPFSSSEVIVRKVIIEAAESSETSKSPEKNIEVSESSGAVTTEYSPSQKEESEPVTEAESEYESKAETETETEQEMQIQCTCTDMSDALEELYTMLNEQLGEDALAREQYYNDMLGYADSINHVCTITLDLCFALLLCVGITCGCMLAQGIWSKFR